jgi:Protein of unknown function (DUF2971)
MEDREQQPTEDHTRLEGLLYHYTDQKGLLGILDSKSIWATHLSYVNDLEEYKVGIRLVERVIEETKIRGLIDGKTEADLKSILKTPDSCDFYAASFSRANNGDALNLWRAYAKSLPGYSLGFSAGRLQEVIRPRSDGIQTNMSWLSEVFYISREENAEPRLMSSYRSVPTISSLIEHLRFNNYKDDISYGMDIEEIVAAIRNNLEAVKRVSLLLMSILPTLKDAGFSDEVESRVIQLRYDGAPSNTTNPVQFHHGSWSIVPHVKIPISFGEHQPPVIERIVIGPCPHPAEAKKAIQILLNSKGLSSIEVDVSKIPYRNW